MKKHREEAQFELHIRPRTVEQVPLEIPKDTLESLKQVAASREMSYHALLKFYIGQGLRRDISHLFADRLIETTVQVLSQHLQSEEDVSAIIREIQAGVAV